MKYLYLLTLCVLISSCCSFAKSICSECEIKYPTEIIIIKKSVVAKECGFNTEQKIEKPIFYYDENKKMSFIVSQQIISNDEYHELKNTIINNYENKINQYNICILETQKILDNENKKELDKTLNFYKNNVQYSVKLIGD
jgi:hypothetical protein